ncbi:MAG: VWA domain-containing protein [Gemmataceae bacterium]|nr:VWA domain-containing protein [Gemmataceae bacterium]MCI0741488.1 VWA domain-containing protein [Gemmataceae bacterium]
MLRIPLPWENWYLLLAPRFGELPAAGQGALLALFLLVPIGLSVWLYRNELRLVARRAALLLLLLRLCLLFILGVVTGFQPTLAYYYEEELPSRVLVAVDVSRSMNVADTQRTAEEKDTLGAALGLPRDHLDDLTRLAIVKKFFKSNNFLSKMGRNHGIELLGFDQSVSTLEEIQQAARLGLGTDLNAPLGRALESAAEMKGKVLGVIVFTDGQHNIGKAPTLRAKELAKSPVYPVAVGSKIPPADIALLEVKAPANAFKDTDFAVAARLRLSGIPVGEIEVTLAGKDKVAAQQKKTIRHDGQDRVVEVQFSVKAEHVGNHVFEIKAQSLTKDVREISLENNQAATVVRVADDKIRVLLVDNEARWEFHYLANALLRDPAVKPDLVLFSQPRVGTLSEEKLEKLGHARVRLPEKAPSGDEPLERYDVIVLGDVPPDKLPLAERRRLEAYVSQRGGTLVLVAGKRHMPLEFLAAAGAADDPLCKLLPILTPRVRHEADGFALRLSNEGGLVPFLRMEEDAEANRQRWLDLPKHYWAITAKPKPGGKTLAYLSTKPESKESEGDAVLVEHSYGFGKVVFMGLESTWRWRFRVGDHYHHRFWGQLTRWAAADQLLPTGNKFVRFGSRQAVVPHGQHAELAARLSEDVPLLKDKSTARAKLWRQLGGGKEEAALVVPLETSAQQARLLQAKAPDLPPGVYRIELDIPELKDKLVAKDPLPNGRDSDSLSRGDTFTVLPPEDRELADLAVNWSLLQALADESNGRQFTIENANELVDLFARQVEKREDRQEERVWADPPLVWWLLGLLLGLLTLEWLGRKLAGLP